VTSPPRADEGLKVVCRNKKARHDYRIDETFEAGLALVGSEVKSLREGRVTLTDAYGEVRSGEVWLVGSQVSEYPYAHARNHDPRRDRKLLMHREEIRRLAGKVREKGYSLIPLEIYFKRGRAKVALSLAKGKREYEHREDKKRQEAQREMKEAMKRRRDR
jgi:SsrA-binding protein